MIIKSDSPAVTIPEVTVTEYILRQAARRSAILSAVSAPAQDGRENPAVEIGNST